MNALVARYEDEPREGWAMPDGSPWPGNDRADHVGMIQVKLLSSKLGKRQCTYYLCHWRFNQARLLMLEDLMVEVGID